MEDLLQIVECQWQVLRCVCWRNDVDERLELFQLTVSRFCLL